MSPETRTSILFWCQVGLYVTAMVAMLGLLATLVVFVVSSMRTMDENREKDRAMLQQHYTDMQQHHEAMLDHRAFMNRLSQH